jgi:hypothetical protein
MPVPHEHASQLKPKPRPPQKRPPKRKNRTVQDLLDEFHALHGDKDQAPRTVPDKEVKKAKRRRQYQRRNATRDYGPRSSGAATRQRPDMPAAALRTPEARAFSRRMDERSHGLASGILQGVTGVGAALEGGVDFFTGIPTFARDPSLANAGWVAASVVPVGRAGKLASGALRPLTTRALRVGDDVVAEIPGASSRFGRAVEGGYDAAQRRIAPRAAERKALREARRGTERRRRFLGSGAAALQKAGRRLTAEQQASLFYLAEGAKLSDRARFHADTAARLRATGAKGSRTAAKLHDVSAGLVRGASRYLEDTADGVRLRPDAPGELREAWRLIEQSSATREQILKAIDPDLAAALKLRVDKPAQKLGSAAGRTYMPHSRGVPGQARFHPRLLRSAAAASVSRRQGTLIRAIGRDTHLQKEWTGALMDTGMLRSDATNLTAESLLRATKLDALRHYRSLLLRVSKTRDEIVQSGDNLEDFHPILADIRHPQIPAQTRVLIEQMEMGQLTKTTLRQYDNTQIDDLRKAVFGEMVAGLPDDAIRFVRRDLFEQVTKEATQYRVLGDSTTRGFSRLLAGAANNLNDIQRFAVLYINPLGYGVTNLLGNAALSVMHQGALLPVRAAQALAIGKKLPAEDLAALDELAGAGNILATFSPKGVVRGATQGYVNTLHKLVDLIPRRMSLIHELKKMGYGDPKVLSQLMREARSGSEGAWQKLNQAAQRANDAMVDYERLTPFERNIVSKVLFVYPWVKGSARYTARFPLEHPVLTGGLAVAAKEQQENRPEGPFYIESTVMIPEWFPYLGGKVWDPATILPFKTPIDAARGALSLVTDIEGAPEFADELNPLISSGISAITGRDEFGRELEGGFFGAGGGILGELGQQIVESSRPYVLQKEFRESPDEQANDIYPYTRNDLIARAIVGSAAPRSFNPKESAERAAEESAPPKVTHSSMAKADQWIRNHPDLVNPGYVEYAVRAREMYDRMDRIQKYQAEKLGIKESGLTDRQEAAIKLHVLLDMRPELFQGITEEQAFEVMRAYMTLPDSDPQRGDYIEMLNDALEFEDVLGYRITNIVEKAKEQVAP